MNLKIILSAALLLTSISLKAQYEDRVITNNHDTIPCKLSRTMMGAFKYKTAKGEATKIEMGNVREFYSANKKTWVRRVYITSFRVPCFVNVIINGKLSLFEMNGGSAYYNGSLTYSSSGYGADVYHQHSKTQYYVLKTTDTAEVVWDDDLSRSKSKDLMEAKFVPFIQDNKIVYDRYAADRRVNADELKKLVEMYNGSK